MFLSDLLNRYRLSRGERIITCPDNEQPAAVRVAAWGADLHLRSCSRWPEMAGCAEDCLRQIETSPHACRVQTIVSSWYEGKRCHYCTSEIGAIVWHERPPALRMPNGTTREWKDIRAEELPGVFATAEAVCWKCNLAETFRREHGELVVERRRVAARTYTIPPSVAVY